MNDTFAPGQMLYFSAIMVSINGDDGSVRKGPFKTLNEPDDRTGGGSGGIQGAEGWAHPEDLEDYFDIAVDYNPDEPLTLIYQFVKPDGTRQEYQRFNKGTHQLFTNTQVLLDDTITDAQGRIYTLSKSYINPKLAPGVGKYPQVTGDAALKTRNFTMDIGGTNVIGEYTASNNPGLTIDSHDFCVDEGTASYQLHATLTKSDGTTVTLTSHPNLTWSSSNSSAATVSSSGVVTSSGNQGFTQISAHFVDAAQSMDETANTSVDVTVCSQTGGCTYDIGSPTKGAIASDSVMDPAVTGELKADNRGSEKFDVSKGIPTSEDLYANVFAKNYLFQNKWANMTGQVTFTVTVKKVYHKTWTVPGVPSSGPGDPGTAPVPMQMDVPVTKDMTIKRDYSYWQIDNLEAYEINNATVSNYALGGFGGKVTLNPNGYTRPVLDTANNDAVTSHVHPQPCNVVDLGTEPKDGGASEPPTPDETLLFQSKAETEVKENKVNNDKVIFNGSTIMDANLAVKTAPTPGTIPQPAVIGQDVLYKDNLTISSTLLNKLDQPTTGRIYYDLVPGNIKGGGDKDYPINGINTVTVHTPVVNYAVLPDDNRPFDQRMEPDMTRTVLVLDRPFTIHIPESGQHLNYPGYGNRDYANIPRRNG